MFSLLTILILRVQHVLIIFIIYLFSLKYFSIQYATVDVHYLPLFPAVVCPGLFIAPVFSTFFPLLPSDVPRLQKFLRGIVCL